MTPRQCLEQRPRTSGIRPSIIEFTNTETRARRDGVDAAKNGRPARTRVWRGISAVAVILFAMAGEGFLKCAQNPVANVNQQIGPDQLVREVIQNELKAQTEDKTTWRYRDLKENDGKKQLRDVIQTKNGEIDRLIAVNLEPLTPKQKEMEDARIRRMLSHPDEIRRERQKQDEDSKKESELLQSFPRAFSYEYAGVDGDLVKLKFAPNPNFHPSKRQEQVFHHMEGTMWIDVHQKRLAGIDGLLMSEVRFGGGILGHLNKGGRFSVRLKDVGSGHWGLDSLDVQMEGKALLFKTISLQEKERCTNYERIPDDMTLRQAAQMQGKSSASAQSIASTH